MNATRNPTPANYRVAQCLEAYQVVDDRTGRPMTGPLSNVMAQREALALNYGGTYALLAEADAVLAVRP